VSSSSHSRHTGRLSNVTTVAISFLPTSPLYPRIYYRNSSATHATAEQRVRFSQIRGAAVSKTASGMVIDTSSTEATLATSLLLPTDQLTKKLFCFFLVFCCYRVGGCHRATRGEGPHDFSSSHFSVFILLSVTLRKQCGALFTTVCEVPLAA